jgi:hypothetical protein
MPENRPPAYLEPGCAYLSTDFKARMRLGESGWRHLKRQGLITHRIGKSVVVLADDFIEFLQSRDNPK